MNTDVESAIRFKLTEIANTVSNLEVERDDAIAFLRKCQIVESSEDLNSMITEYLNDYDIPF